jgi:hypothetical protein
LVDAIDGYLGDALCVIAIDVDADDGGALWTYVIGHRNDMFNTDDAVGRVRLDVPNDTWFYIKSGTSHWQRCDTLEDAVVALKLHVG